MKMNKKLACGIGIVLFSGILGSVALGNYFYPNDIEQGTKQSVEWQDKHDGDTTRKPIKNGKGSKKTEEEDTVKKTLNRYGITTNEEVEFSQSSATLTSDELRTVATVIQKQKESQKETTTSSSPNNVEDSETPIVVPPIDDPGSPELPVEPEIPVVVPSTPMIHFEQNIVVAKNMRFDPYLYFYVSDEKDDNVNVHVDTSELNVAAVGLQSFLVIATNKFGNSTVAKIPVFVSSVPTITLQSSEVEVMIGSFFEPKKYATAYDELQGDLTATMVADVSQLEMDREGTYTVVYTVKNQYGYTNYKELKVHVKNEAPEIFASDVYHEINQEFDPLAGVTAVAYNGDTISLTEDNIIENTVDVHTEGVYKVTYQVIDRFGKVSQPFDRKVVVENEAPVIIGATNKTIHVGEEIQLEWLLEGVSATDREDNKQGIEIEVTVNNEQVSNIDNNVPGEYPLTYYASDSMGKETTESVVITVINDKPTISGIFDVSIYAGDSFDPYEGISAMDTEDGVIGTENIIITNEVDTMVPGVYELSYQVSDSHGLQSDVYSRIVTVLEKDMVQTNNSEQ